MPGSDCTAAVPSGGLSKFRDGRRYLKRRREDKRRCCEEAGGLRKSGDDTGGESAATSRTATSSPRRTPGVMLNEAEHLSRASDVPSSRFRRLGIREAIGDMACEELPGTRTPSASK